MSSPGARKSGSGEADLAVENVHGTICRGTICHMCLTGAPESSSKIVLAYMFTALYADYDLGALRAATTRHYAAPLYVMPMALYANSSPDHAQTHLHCHFLENDSPAGICNKKLPRI